MKSIQEIFPRASKSFIEANPDINRVVNIKNVATGIVDAATALYETDNHRKIQDSKPQHHQTPTLDSANEGEKEGILRTRIRFTGYRVRPLDPDNFAGSCKDLLDGCVHSGLIHGDEPWRIIFETHQEKVGTYAEEKTIIEIETY